MFGGVDAARLAGQAVGWLVIAGICLGIVSAFRKAGGFRGMLAAGAEAHAHSRSAAVAAGGHAGARADVGGVHINLGRVGAGGDDYDRSPVDYDDDGRPYVFLNGSWCPVLQLGRVRAGDGPRAGASAFDADARELAGRVPAGRDLGCAGREVVTGWVSPS